MTSMNPLNIDEINEKETALTPDTPSTFITSMPSNPITTEKDDDIIEIMKSDFIENQNQKNNNDNTDCDVIIQSSTVTNPNISFSHLRKLCGVHDFEEHPTKYCNKCYCSICNVPAKECEEWSNHCYKQTFHTQKVSSSTSSSSSTSPVDNMLNVLSRNVISRMLAHGTNGVILPNQKQPWDKRKQDEDRDGIRDRRKSDKFMRITDILARNLATAVQISDMKSINQGSDLNMAGDIPQLGLQKFFYMEGVRIGWPFPMVMQPQRMMALHLIRALKRRLHVVLESPTGTGKSAAILCATLAWQRYHAKNNKHSTATSSATVTTKTTTNGTHKKDEFWDYVFSNNDDDNDMEGIESKPNSPKIFYCSRTHSQVAQMVESLKKTPYRPRMTVLGSRERLCIHRNMRKTGQTEGAEKISRLNINQECQFRVSNTEKMRKAIWNSTDCHYNDDNPPIHKLGDGAGANTDFIEEEVSHLPSNVRVDDIQSLEMEEGTMESHQSRLEGNVKQLTCPHYRQLTSTRTANMARSKFILGKSTINCCKVGGEKTKLGVHDIEDLVSFGVNPYVSKKVAVYREQGVGSFGITLQKSADGRVSVHKIVEDGACAALDGSEISQEDSFLKINGKESKQWEFEKVVEEIKGTKNDPLEIDVLRSGVGYKHYGDHNGENVYSDHSTCPYYLSKELAKHAELIFAPYNYILDPAIRTALEIDLEEAVVILDEAHNVEGTLRSSGSAKFGEFELCEILCLLSNYATQQKGSNVVTVGEGVEKDISMISHEMLLTLEKMIEFLIESRKSFENGKAKTSAAAAIEEYKRYHSPDEKEYEVKFFGPTGYGIDGKTVGCKKFFEKMDFSVDQLRKLEEHGKALETFVGGGNEADDHQSFVAQRKGTNLVARLNEFVSKLLLAISNPEHFFVQSVVSANGSLSFASGEDNESNRSRYQKEPKSIPFISPRTQRNPNAPLHACPHKYCRQNPRLGMAVRHGTFCDGAIPRWESFLVLELLTPSILMEDISKKCRTLVLASGTLAPISSLCAELNLYPYVPSTAIKSKPDSSPNKFPSNNILGRLQVQPKPLEANHVIDLHKQLRAVSIGFFPDGSPLTVTMKHYKNLSFFPKLGHAIAGIVEAIPRGGVLVFVPSYSFLKKCVNSWNPINRWNASHQNDSCQDSSIWERFIQSKGQVIIEPTGGQEHFEAAKNRYNEAIQVNGKCILLAVFRGKMSEGISFNDDYARAVICVGIPLPSAFEKAIAAKMAYNDEQRRFRNRMDLLPGRDWYSQQAYRAIAQALGRCIRHAADYGIVILMDSRHCEDGAPVDGICDKHRNLPKWMRHNVLNLSKSESISFNRIEQGNSILGGYDGLALELEHFFRDAMTHCKAVTENCNKSYALARKRENECSKTKFNSHNEISGSSHEQKKQPNPSTKRAKIIQHTCPNILQNIEIIDD